MAGCTPYNPWSDVAERPHVSVRFAPLPRLCRGVFYSAGGRSLIALSDRLKRIGLRCVLTEELIHDERTVRGHALPSDVPGHLLNRREERTVRRLTADRLIPDSAVAAIVREVRCSGECNLWEAAFELDVTPQLLAARLAEVAKRIGPIYPWWSLAEDAA